MSAMLTYMTPLLAEGGGFDPLQFQFGNTFWTWVIFVISLPLMWKVVFKPITTALYERDQKAESAIAAAEEAKRAAEAARAETESKLEEAKAESQRQIREARERAQAQAKELLEQARREADADRQKAIADIDAERRRAIADIRDLAVDVSLDAASRLIKRDMTGDDQKTFVQGFLKDVESLQKN